MTLRVAIVLTAVVLGSSSWLPVEAQQAVPGLAGTWREVASDRDGVVDNKPSGDSWVIDGSTIGQTFQGAGFMWRGTFTANATAKPSEVDLEINEAMINAFKGKALGLFELTGNTLTLCLVFDAEAPATRPSALKTSKGSKGACHSLQRAEGAR